MAPDARRLSFVPPNPWLAACVIVSVIFSVLVAAAFRTGVKNGDLVQLSVLLVAIVPLTLISVSLYTAYVAVTSNTLRVRLGWFVRSIARAEIQHADLTSSGIVLRLRRGERVMLPKGARRAAEALASPAPKARIEVSNESFGDNDAETDARSQEADCMPQKAAAHPHR
jgi:hypothetical protein